MDRWPFRFASHVLIFLLLQGVIFGAMWVYARHAQRDAYLSAVIDKHQRLAQAKRPRVLIVGGSSSAFGVRSDLIGKALNREPVNLALHAGLGRSFILAEAAGAVRKDDVVVLSLEYHLYQQESRTSSHVWAVLMSRPASVVDLRTIPLGALSDSGFQFVHHIARTALWSAIDGPPDEPIYRRAAFNDVGDVTIHHALAPQRPFKAEQQPLKLNRARLEQAIAEMRQLKQACDRVGAQLVVFFPPFEESAYQRDQAPIDALIRQTTRSLRGVVAGDSRDVPLPNEAFFDTSYHLTRDASERRTQTMIRRLASLGVKRWSEPRSTR